MRKKSLSGELNSLPKQVFLCYCHTDLSYARRLRVHIASCQSYAKLALWDISQLKPGSLWRSEIAAALTNAHFAVLLISADFLASSFICTFELPILLAAAGSGGTRILPVIVRPCLFEESPIAAFHAVNSAEQPLSLLHPSAREQIWVSLVRAIIEESCPYI